MLLSARDLHVEYPGRWGGPPARAVDGVDLDVPAGDIVALVGESGCGKSTLVRTLLGLEKPVRGKVLFDGAPVRHFKSYRRQVQLVLQDPTGALNPRHTVYDAVAEGLRIHGRKALRGRGERALVAESLSRAGLRPPERFFHRYPHELSGGQRQRVVIAGALVLEPRLLIADEPVASLDASVRGEILKLLLRLRADEGLSVLVVTHDLGLAWNIADRVAVMYLGRIVESGPVEEILRSPRHPYTRALLSVLPESTIDEPMVLTDEPPDPTRIPRGCRFHPRCPLLRSGAAEAVASSCRTVDLPVVRGAGVACHYVAAAAGASATDSTQANTSAS